MSKFDMMTVTEIADRDESKGQPKRAEQLKTVEEVNMETRYA